MYYLLLLLSIKHIINIIINILINIVKYELVLGLLLISDNSYYDKFITIFICYTYIGARHSNVLEREI